MEQYTIYCTEEQTKKAIKLGAPITVNSWPPINDVKFMWITPPEDAIAWNNSTNCLIPTAEQMIGFLEGIEDINEISIIKSLRGWIFVVYVRGVPLDIEDSKDTFYPTRPEATLAAIDAALDYLISQNRL